MQIKRKEILVKQIKKSVWNGTYNDDIYFYLDGGWSLHCKESINDNDMCIVKKISDIYNVNSSEIKTELIHIESKLKILRSKKNERTIN